MQFSDWVNLVSLAKNKDKSFPLRGISNDSYRVEKKSSKTLVVLFICIVVTVLYTSGFLEELTLQRIQIRLEDLKTYSEKSPWQFLASFAGLYILLTSLAIPGTIILTFLGGAIFGVIKGTLIVTLCASIGAAISFLLSRYLFRDWILSKFRARFMVMDRKFRAQGTWYLFTMRLIPISPFVCINILMGLTSVRFFSFCWITFLGMLPGTSIYVFAGRQLSGLKEPSDIFTPQVLSALILIGLSPFIFKFMIQSNLRRSS